MQAMVNLVKQLDIFIGTLCFLHIIYDTESKQTKLLDKCWKMLKHALSHIAFGVMLHESSQL